MKTFKKMLSLVVCVLLLTVAVVGCAPQASQTPNQSSSPEATQSVTPTTTPEPTPTVDPTPAPEPTPTDAPVPIDAYFIVKDGQSQVTFVYADKETQMIQDAIKEIQTLVMDRCDVVIPIKSDAQLSKVKTPKVVVGKTKITSYDRMGDGATTYDMLVELDGSDIYALGYTQGATNNALENILENIVIMNDCKNVYIKPAAFGLQERPLREYESTWDRFTISGYGAPTFSTYDPDLWTEKDQEVFQSIIDFGIAEIPVWMFDYRNDKNFSREVIKKYIEKFNSVGIKSRVYAFDAGRYMECDDGKTKDYAELEACIKDVVETFGDIEGVAVWGFYDEPSTVDSFLYCADVMELFDKYDAQNRPVYINMEPMVGSVFFSRPLDMYNDLLEIVDPDFYCYDRYPFWRINENGENDPEGEPTMVDDYWYANLEYNRNYGIDASRDTGIIIACITVGQEAGRLEGRADINQEFMDWQVNCSLAYGYKYIEQFVFYTGHAYGLYTKENEKTFRWYIAKEANDYANIVGTMLFDKRLDMVFHLANEDGSYSNEVVAYTGYRNAGEVTGVDAFLSFYDDGTIIVTDKRCCDADGGVHDVTLGGLNGGVEWFNVANNAWEDISTCDAAEVSENGLTLTLERATQYIVRAK